MWLYVLLAIIGGLWWCRIRGQRLYVSKHTAPREQRLLILSDTFGDGGGAENVVKEIMRVVKGPVKHVSLCEVPHVKLFGVKWRWLGLTNAIDRIVRAYRPTQILILHGLGFWSIRYCRYHQLPFTTFLPANLPALIQLYTHLPKRVTYVYLRWLLGDAPTLIPSQTYAQECIQHRINAVHWPHGVDLNRFRVIPGCHGMGLRHDNRLLPKPYYLMVGRLTKEKNIAAFLNLRVRGTKIAVGPAFGEFDLDAAKQQYPDVVFLGPQYGDDLVTCYNMADVLIFPSLTDNFPLTLLEALACGLPFVGYDVTGPRDIADANGRARLGENVPRASYLVPVGQTLDIAAEQAVIDRHLGRTTSVMCHDHVSQYSWSRAREILDRHLTAFTIS